MRPAMKESPAWRWIGVFVVVLLCLSVFVDIAAFRHSSLVRDASKNKE